MAEIKKKCSQNTIIVLCWLVYTMAYLGRYSYNSNISLIMDDFGINHAGAGLVTTCFFFAYGIGQVVNGLMCRRYNKKYLFPIVLFISSALNLLVLVVPFGCIKYMWLLNGFLQSCLWSSIINILGRNLDSNHLNRALLLMSTTATIGTAITYGSSAFFVWLGNYRLIFLFAPVVMSVIGVLWLLIFRDKQEETVEEKEENKGKGSVKSVLYIFVALAFFAVVDNLVKDGLSTWVPAILTEEYGLKDEVSILSSIVLPVLGTFGAIVALNLNKIIKNFVSLSTVLFAMAAVIIFIIMNLGESGAWIMVVCFGVVMCMMHGINNVITSIAPLKMRDKAEPGKLAGILNGCCYMGSTISSYGLGAIADRGGWQYVFLLLVSLCGLCVLVGIVFSFVKRSDNV